MKASLSIIPLFILVMVLSSCEDSAIDSVTGGQSVLFAKSSIPTISYDAEITSRVMPESGSLQDMCKVDLLMIQRLPAKEHVEFVMDTATTPCINIDRSGLTYDLLREGKRGDNDFVPMGSLSICNGQTTQVYGDTTVTYSGGLDIQYWQSLYSTLFYTTAQVDSTAEKAYEEMLSAGVAVIDGDFLKIKQPDSVGNIITKYISTSTLLPHSEVVADANGKWQEKYFYQYYCQADSSYIPFITLTYRRDTTMQCGTPYVMETVTEYKNYTKTNI